jgi:hypothetical protein
MKINFLKFKKEKVFKKENFDINVNFYWKILLYISLAFIVFAFVFGSYLFLTINKDFVLPDTQKSRQVEKINQIRIKNILNYFIDKETRSTIILNSPSPVVDPSK